MNSHKNIRDPGPSFRILFWALICVRLYVLPLSGEMANALYGHFAATADRRPNGAFVLRPVFDAASLLRKPQQLWRPGGVNGVG